MIVNQLIEHPGETALLVALLQYIFRLCGSQALKVYLSVGLTYWFYALALTFLLWLLMFHLIPTEKKTH